MLSGMLDALRHNHDTDEEEAECADVGDKYDW